MDEFIIMNDFGLTEEEISAIWKRFTCNLSYKDWENISICNENELEAPEEDDDYLKLPTGRWAIFDDDLIHKDKLAQMD